MVYTYTVLSTSLFSCRQKIMKVLRFDRLFHKTDNSLSKLSPDGYYPLADEEVRQNTTWLRGLWVHKWRRKPWWTLGVERVSHGRVIPRCKTNKRKIGKLDCDVSWTSSTIWCKECSISLRKYHVLPFHCRTQTWICTSTHCTHHTHHPASHVSQEIPPACLTQSAPSNNLHPTRMPDKMQSIICRKQQPTPTPNTQQEFLTRCSPQSAPSNNLHPTRMPDKMQSTRILDFCFHLEWFIWCKVTEHKCS